jgi:hypothetical protein
MVLIYGEVRGNSELARQIYGEKRYFPMHEKFVNVVQHLRDFGRFEMNKRDLGRQQEYHILIAEEEIHQEIENQSRTSTRCPSNLLRVSQFVVWRTLKEQGSGTKTSGFTFDVSFYSFTQNHSLDLLLMFHFILLLKITVFLFCCSSVCCFLNKLLAQFYQQKLKP